MLNLTIRELQDIAEKRNIDGYQNISREQLENLFAKLPLPTSTSMTAPRLTARLRTTPDS